MAHLASAVRSAAALPEYQKLEAEVPTCPSPQLETLRARMELLALEKSPVPADLNALVERRRSELQARLSPRPNPTPKNPAN
jgi:hypothetical protein